MTNVDHHWVVGGMVKVGVVFKWDDKRGLSATYTCINRQPLDYLVEHYGGRVTFFKGKFTWRTYGDSVRELATRYKDILNDNQLSVLEGAGSTRQPPTSMSYTRVGQPNRVGNTPPIREGKTCRLCSGPLVGDSAPWLCVPCGLEVFVLEG